MNKGITLYLFGHPNGPPQSVSCFKLSEIARAQYTSSLQMNSPTNFLNHKRPLVLAHRGASAVAPQNTLAAFKKAMELGADGVELDVQLSADGVPVVIHDMTVDTLTDGTGRVSEMSLAQLKELDAGASFDPAFTGERIPTLDEVLEAVGDTLLLNIELKTYALRDTGLEQAVLHLVQRHALGPRALFSSFNPLALRRVKRLSPTALVGLLYAPELPLPLRKAWLAPLFPHEARHPEHTMVNAAYMAWAHRRGYRVHTWTVDDAVDMQRLIHLRVDGVITNRPDRLLALLDGDLDNNNDDNSHDDGNNESAS